MTCEICGDATSPCKCDFSPGVEVDVFVCDHGVTFDPEAARGLPAAEVRERWPRFFGTCPTCGWEGIAYASREHYYSGDW
jgi:hypothetical protein